MTLALLWFILIAILWIGFFVLEGFDFGVGMLLPVLDTDEDGSRDESSTRRRTMLTTIGPHWDGNQVWFITGASRGMGIDIARAALAAGRRFRYAG